MCTRFHIVAEGQIFSAGTCALITLAAGGAQAPPLRRTMGEMSEKSHRALQTLC